MALDFNLTHLRYFYDSARLGGIGLAAAKNFVGSSTISQGIKKLEQSLDVDLLHHKKRDFRLTNEGSRLLIECEKIFLSIKNFETEIHSSKKEPSGILNLASSNTVVSTFLLPSIRKVREQFPLILPSVRLGKTSLLKDLLLNRETDLVITVDDGNFNAFETIEIHRGDFIVIENSKEKSKNQEFLISKKRPDTENLKEYYRKQYGHELPVFVVFESWDLIAQGVEYGLGRGLVPDFILMKKSYKNLRPAKFGFKFPYRLIAAHRKNETVSTTTKIFLEILTQRVEGH